MRFFGRKTHFFTETKIKKSFFDFFRKNSNFSIDLSSLSIGDWYLDFEIKKRKLPPHLAREILFEQLRKEFRVKLKHGYEYGYIYIGHDRDLIYQTLDSFLSFAKTFMPAHSYICQNG